MSQLTFKSILATFPRANIAGGQPLIKRPGAALKLAGWFDRVAGVLVGDFRMMHADTQPAVVELLRYHLPASRRVPVVTTRSFGHVWPMTPVLLNRPVRLASRGRTVTIWAGGVDL